MVISSLLIGKRIGVNLHTLYTDRFLGSVFLVDLDGLHFIQSIPSFDHASEDSVLSIKVRGFVEGQEELTAIGIGTSVGHAEDATLIVFELRFDLILEWLTINAWTIFSRSGGRRAGLDHEGGNEAMKWRVIVCVGSTQREEVVGRLWSGAAEKLKLEGAMRCV